MSDPAASRRPSLDRRALLASAGAALACVATGGVAVAQESEAPPDPRLVLETVTFPLRRQIYKGQLVRLRGQGKRPGLMLIHDQRGPNPHFRQLARRFALDGFTVLLPDLTSPYNLPEGSEEAENALSRTAPVEVMLALDTAADLLIKHPDCNGSIGVLGFAWGGSFALQFAMTGTKVKAAVAFYAQPPAVDRIVEVKVPVQFHWSENDPRTAPVAETIEKRLTGVGKTFEAWVYPDTQSGFASDPGSRRWNRAASDRALDRSVFFLKRWVGG
jgi:carboxymethylenebutenolidase